MSGAGLDDAQVQQQADRLDQLGLAAARKRRRDESERRAKNILQRQPEGRQQQRERRATDDAAAGVNRLLPAARKVHPRFMADRRTAVEGRLLPAQNVRDAGRKSRHAGGVRASRLDRSKRKWRPVDRRQHAPRQQRVQLGQRRGHAGLVNDVVVHGPDQQRAAGLNRKVVDPHAALRARVEAAVHPRQQVRRPGQIARRLRQGWLLLPPARCQVVQQACPGLDAVVIREQAQRRMAPRQFGECRAPAAGVRQ